MEIADVFYLLGSIVMGLLIILLVTMLVLLLILRRKLSNVQTWVRRNLIGKVMSLWIAKQILRKLRSK